MPGRRIRRRATAGPRRFPVFRPAHLDVQRECRRSPSSPTAMHRPCCSSRPIMAKTTTRGCKRNCPAPSTLPGSTPSVFRPAATTPRNCRSSSCRTRGEPRRSSAATIMLKPQWREYTLFFAEFKDDDKAITPEQLRRVRAFMFVINRRRSSSRVLLDQIVLIMPRRRRKPRRTGPGRGSPSGIGPTSPCSSSGSRAFSCPTTRRRIPAPPATAVKLRRHARGRRFLARQSTTTTNP